MKQGTSPRRSRRDFPFESVSIVPDEQVFGLVFTKRWAKFRVSDCVFLEAKCRLDSDILVLLAGRAAERRFLGRCWVARLREDIEDGSYDDRRLATTFATILFGREKMVNTFLEYMAARAEDVVDAVEAWVGITGLAESLLQRRKLTARQAKRVFTGALARVSEEAPAIDLC